MYGLIILKFHVAGQYLLANCFFFFNINLNYGYHLRAVYVTMSVFGTFLSLCLIQKIQGFYFRKINASRNLEEKKKQYLQNKYHLRFVNAALVLTGYTGQLFVLFVLFCFVLFLFLQNLNHYNIATTVLLKFEICVEFFCYLRYNTYLVLCFY